MLAIPSWLQTEYRAWLRNLAIPMNQHGFFMKWLRYYLDFCQKYHMVDSEERTLGSFLDKLREKKQTKVQQEQATQAIMITYQLLQTRERGSAARLSQEVGTPAKALSPADSESVSPAKGSGTSQQATGAAGKAPKSDGSPGEAPTESYQPSGAPPRDVRHPVVRAGSASIQAPGVSEPAGTGLAHVAAPVQEFRSPIPSTRTVSTATGVSWKDELAKLVNEIRVRHYSKKTLRTYTQWVRHLQTFTRSQDPKLLSADEVKAFLTHLAVNRKVSASTQNQTFNALLFF